LAAANPVGRVQFFNEANSRHRYFTVDKDMEADVAADPETYR
jgi:hypothetical protein